MSTTTDVPVVSVRNLTKHFGVGGLLSRRRLRALHDVSFDIGRGEIVALVGESGSGKSTVARVLARLERPTSGRITVDGADILRTEPRCASRKYRGRVQMVFQDPYGSLNPVHRIRHFLTRPLLLHGRARGADAVRQALRELMAAVGLRESMLDSYPHQLSGGQRQRVAIARALAAQPEVILADEPTSMLDVSVRIGVLNLMRRLRDERGISMLYITHDLASARYVADTTMVMYAGELVEGGDAADVMAGPAHPYTRLLVSAVPDPRRASGSPPATRSGRPSLVDPAPGCPFAGRCPQAMDVCRSTAPERTDLGSRHWVRCHLYADAATTTIDDTEAG